MEIVRKAWNAVEDKAQGPERAKLKHVAEEVQQPIKKNRFENKEPDLWGPHVESRW